MVMIAPNEARLPRIDEPPPNLALMVIGRALAQAYGEVGARPLPEPLARIVLQIEHREVCNAYDARSIG
jgi:hypothetical protein